MKYNYAKHFKDKNISLIIQEKNLLYSQSNCKIFRIREESLIATFDVSPTSLSPIYKVKIKYKKKERISVFVVNPKPLTLAEGKKTLPHVYSTPQQKLCLYYPKDMEFNPLKVLWVESLVKWINEWFFYYEIWLINGGEWLGPEIKHDDEKEK